MPRKTKQDAGRKGRRNGCFNEAAARCRGKPRNAQAGRHDHVRFNEAAARCRGKRARRAKRAVAVDPASMRPRPDAAENGVVSNDSAQFVSLQ